MLPPINDNPFDEEAYRELQGAVRTVDDTTALKDRVAAIVKLHDGAGWGENGKEAIKAGAIELLVHQGSDFSGSGSRSVQSMRRAAVACLAEMSNYAELAARVAAAGLVDHLPPMLEDSLKRYRYGQSGKSMEQDPDQAGSGRSGRAGRQGQMIAERLLNLCANIVGLPYPVGQVLALCGEPIVEHFNAFARVLATGVGAAEDEPHLRNNPEWRDAPRGVGASTSGGGGGAGAEMRGVDVHQNADGSYTFDADDDFSDWPDIPNPMSDNFCRFWANGLRWLTSPAEQDRLVAKGLVGKLRQVEGTMMSGQGMALAALQPAWERHAKREARKARGDLQELAESAKQHRHRGNEAFQAGQYEAAAEDLALLRLERYNESLAAAHDATQFDPLKPKFWARLGDAHRGLGQHACALLCYEQAAKLAPKEEEIQRRWATATNCRRSTLAGCIPRCTRKEAAEAAVEPGQRLDPATLPRKDDICKDREFMMRVVAMGEADVSEALMDAEVDRATRKLLGLAPDGTEDWAGTPRGIAMQKITPLLDLAESAATAKDLPMSNGRWCISWSDTLLMIDQPAPMFIISVMDGHEARASMLRPGRPTAATIIQALKYAMTHPQMPSSRRERLADVLVAHRMRGEYAVVEAELRRMGVGCFLETREEALATAAAHGTDPDGFNFAEENAAEHV
ncbi:Serine threonine-phosphatase [Micractinium conductrix]|uniref:Serine threonine-phosphatase n=1 Tax=Micractinium conductrix TaxID=554055 RepID=A0A2P6V7X5_9CHLO|nr:Serine threonine-phosphatase [Micractinium conductrix]|eukprot:PSC70189.1 Serine threonine-phosphatase [Micractinium conductrix]